MKPEVQKQLSEKVRRDYQILASAMDMTRSEIWPELLPFLPDCQPKEKVWMSVAAPAR
jgi:lambda repressor-like predicted transcriptional regulator